MWRKIGEEGRGELRKGNRGAEGNGLKGTSNRDGERGMEWTGNRAGRERGKCGER